MIDFRSFMDAPVDNSPAPSNHGYLQLNVTDFPFWYHRDLPYKTIFEIILNPGFTVEEYSAMNYLSSWMKQRGYYAEISWSPVYKRKIMSNEQKYKRAVTFWKNKIRKKYPLFWEEIFAEKVVILKKRYNMP